MLSTRTLFRNVLFIAILCVIFTPLASFAAEIPASEVNFGLSNVDSSIGLSNDTSIIEIITNIIRVVLGLLGIIVVGLILYAGFLWMTAAGNDEKIATAKKIMTNAVIGLAIILSAFTITQFVIRSLSDATGSGSFNDDDSSIGGCTTEDGCSPTFCTRNGFNSACIDQTFFVKSITPSTEDTDGDTATYMNNAVVRVVFSRPVASANIDSALVVRDENNAIVPVQITGRHGNRVLEARSTEGEGTWTLGAYTIEVESGLEDYQGGSLETTDVRGTSYPRQTEFYINRVYEDTAQPEIQSLSINGSENPEVLFVGDVLTVDLQATDRAEIPEGLAHPVGGVGYASIDVRTGSRSVYTHYVGPTVRRSGSGGSSEVFTTQYVQTITATDFPSGATYSVRATVYDIDGNSSVLTRTFSVYPATCNNGVLDPGEADVDQGGVCGSEEGDTCTVDSDCSPYMQCSVEGICEANPIILDFDPKDAASNNWVTVFGRYFGSTAGTVAFGYPNGGDYTWIEAAFPSRLECPVGDVWQSNWTIVTVPDGLPERDDIAIRITRASEEEETAPPSDTTTDDRGTTDQFERNTTERPGLCAVLSLDTGNPSGAPGESVSLSGRGFIENTTEIYWGTRVGRMTEFQSSALFESIVPQEFGNGFLGVRVQNDTVSSNGVPFVVQTQQNANDPVISYISPVTTTRDSYFTLVGSGFGQPYGSVYLSDTTEHVQSCAAGNASADITCYTLTVDLPNRCGTTWSSTEVVVAATDIADTTIPSGTYALALKTIGGRITNGIDTITIVDGPALPSICKLTPNTGPAPLAAGDTVRIVGSHFGETTGTVRFWDTGANVSTVGAGWLTATDEEEIREFTDTRVQTIFPTKSNGLTIPVGLPVPIVVQSATGLFSNAVTYTANVCTADTPLDEDRFQCCLAGPEAGQIKPAAYACEGETKTAGYTWRIASGILPRIPRVLEQCYPESTSDDTAMPPSPSPSTLWEESGTSACVNALVGVQFSMASIDPATLDGNVRMYVCDAGQGRGCDETNNLAEGLGIDDIGDLQTLRIYDGSVEPLEADTWYRVEIDTDVESVETVEIAGRSVEQRQNLLATRDCGAGTAYCFDFKTSAFGEQCTMVDAFLVPRTRTIRELGPVESSPGYLTRFQVYGEANQSCISLSARNIGWEWNALDSSDTAVAVDLEDNGAFEINQINPSWDDIRTLLALIELPNQPLELRAATTTAITDESPTANTIVATSTITIALGDPEVTTYWPNCTAACSNATLGVRFNRVMMREDFIEDNVTVYTCTDRICTSDRSQFSVSIDANDTTNRGFEIIPDAPLSRDTWYRVEISGIHAIGGYNRDAEGTLVPIEGDMIDTFVWGFKTKPSFDGCFVDTVDISPSSYIARFVGERTTFSVIPFGTPDQCSPYGQRLNPFDYDWAWSIPLVPESYRDVVDITANTIASVSAPGCTSNCTPAGSDRRRSADTSEQFICGNGVLDPGETCDIDMPGEVAGRSGQTDPYTCSYSCQRPGNGTEGTNAAELECGNGVVNNPQVSVESIAGEECDAGDLNGEPNSGCSNSCTLTGSSATFSGDLAASFCSISEGVFDGVLDAGEECEINTSGELVYTDSTGATRTTNVPNPRAYCSDTCLLAGTELSQEWCDLQTSRGVAIPACKKAVSICGNAAVESGEACEILARGTVTSSIRILTDLNRSTPLAYTEIELPTEDAVRICAPSCLLGDICEYQDLFVSSEGETTSNLWCDPDEQEGCTNSCTLAGSSLGYTFLSQCRDNVVGTGEYAMCEVASDSAQFAAPSQVATAKGESLVVNSSTQMQESLITVETKRFIGVDEAGEPEIQDIATGDVITAEAPYVLQCGFEEYETPEIISVEGSDTEIIEYNGCPNSSNGFDDGVATNSCCYGRPTVSETYPEAYGINVCRNTLLEVTFEDEVIEKASLQNNILLAMHIPFTAEDRAAEADGVLLPSCAEQGLEDITNIVSGTIGDRTDGSPVIAMNFFGRMWQGVKSLFARLVDTVFAYDTDATTFAGLDGVWCDASVALRTEVLYVPNAEGTSGASNVRLTISRLLNADTMYTLLLRSGAEGITNDMGVSIQPNDNTTIYVGVPFQTGDEICKIDTISVMPEEYLFQRPGQPQEFVIETVNGRGERVVPIENVYDWRYNWAPSLSELFVIPTDEFVSTSDIGIIASRDIEAQQTAQGRVQIITDTATDLGDQTDRFFTATTDLYARFCANLWGDPRDTSRWQPFKNTRFNFEFWYCADAGLGSTTDDDLPLFNNISQSANRDLGLPDTDPIDNIIERTFFFNTSDFNDDAFGIQVFLNPNRYSAREWYRENFGSDAVGFQSVTIDGYDAITNGTTYYINALNISYSEDIIPTVDGLFSNVYQFTINEGAREDTQRAFAEIMKNLRFNTNMTDFGYCLTTEDSRRSRTEVINDTLACTTDFDCRTVDGTPKLETSGICSNNRTALFRDLERIEDINSIQYRLETEGRANAGSTYPTLQSGTFYPGYTMSRWPSWGRFIGGIPGDPINQWSACGDPLTTDQQTCWDPTDSLYYCPAESSVYEYAVNSITNEYSLHAQFEFLERSDAIFGDLLDDSASVSTNPWCEPNTTSSPFGNTCGDGIVQPNLDNPAEGEQCDPPGKRSEPIACTTEDGEPGVQFTTCSASCRNSEPTVCAASATCGNGIVEGAEQCDAGDRNGLYGVGCSDSCTVSESLSCGNGTLDFNDSNDDGVRQSSEPYYEFCEEVGGICQFVFDDVQKIEPMLYFLIDRSGSMGSSFTPTGGSATTRWNIITSADGLPRVFAGLENKALAGLGVFSSDPQSLTTMSFTDLTHVNALNAGLSSVVPSGQTYLGEAVRDLIIGQDVFNTGDSIDSQRPKSLILVVDGSANDNPIPFIEQLREEQNIYTYVIGVGTTVDAFDDWALAGGTGSFYRVDNANELLVTIRNLTRCYSYSLRPGNTCNDSCTGFGTYCGDGSVQTGQGETCDDGNYDNRDGCDTYCRVEVPPTTPVTPAAPAGSCGDGLVQTRNTSGIREACDLGSQNGIAPPGVYGEVTTYCSADCRNVLTVDQAGYCGDGFVQPEEVCDVNDGLVFGTVCVADPDVICPTRDFCPIPGDIQGCRVVNYDSTPDPVTGLPSDPRFDALSCSSSDVGSYSCTNSCQVLVNNCVSCNLNTATVAGGTRNAAIDATAKLDLRFLNPLGQRSGDNLSTNNIYLANSGLKWKIQGIPSVNIVGTSPPSNDGVLITRSPGMDDAWYYSQPDYYIETDDQCVEYGISFVYGSYSSGNYTPANTFPFVVNNESNRIEQVYTVSPALPPDNIRIVVRWEDYGTDSRAPKFKGGLYYTESGVGATSKTIVQGNIPNNDMCDRQIINSGGYFVPDSSCTRFDTSVYYHRPVKDNATPKNGTGIQGITIDINELSTSIPSDRKVAYFVQPDSGVIAPYQRDGKVHVDVYTYRTSNRPDEFYVPTYSFALDSADLSSNDIASTWHVFNLVNNSGSLQIEMLDAANTGLPLTSISTSVLTSEPDILHGKVKTRFCEIQENADNLARGELCNPS